MSAEATGWVFRHSPYKGATFSVHLAIADSVNDHYRNEFWMEQGKLGAKARVRRQGVCEALAQLEQDGFIKDLGAVEGTRGIRRVRFLFPSTPVVYESRWVEPDAPVRLADTSTGRPVRLADTTCPQNGQLPVRLADTEPNKEPNRTQTGTSSRRQPASQPPTPNTNGHAPHSQDHPYWWEHPNLLTQLQQFAPPPLLDGDLAQWCDDVTSNTSVYWDDQMRRYVVWLETKPPSRRHKNLPRGFKAWINEAIRRDQWKETNGARTR